MTCDPDQYERRITELIVNRGMTRRAATIVIDAAMYGIGCMEGRVREQIEAQKNKPTS